jgi:3-hydroxy-9,10-secoandrosta-1,3,5(10)-triene-9,17-dione monooxygenase reductase component
VRETGRFGVHVLAGGQEDLARLFASKRPEREKFAGVAHTVHDGIPVIEGVLAWVGCRLERLIPGGDHTIGIGAVVAAEAGRGEPLLWFRGSYHG